MFKKFQHIHFVGIGGIGMSGIAEVLLNLGYEVSGSDLKHSPVTARLKKRGAKIFLGHRPGYVDGAHAVVVSSAVKGSNPEVKKARARGVPVVPRAEMLAELMRMKYGIAIAGTHGKTTTTSMIGTVLSEAGCDPTLIIGGRLNSLGSNARLGRGEFLVAEADESDRSFLKLNPAIAVITNIDPEHMENYKNFAEMRRCFEAFANKVPFYGAVVACADHPEVRRIFPGLARRLVTYGLKESAEYTARHIGHSNGGMDFEVCYHGEALGKVRLNLPGVHHVGNALACVAVARELDIPFLKIAAGLKKFGGIGRRFEILKSAGPMVVDDYAHHPVEIEATLAAAKAGWPSMKIAAVIQPHRFSRLENLWDDFVRVLGKADMAVILPVYAAGEKPAAGVTGKDLFLEVRRAHPKLPVVYAESLDEVTAALTPWLGEAPPPVSGQKARFAGEKGGGEETMVLFLGAGDITKMAKSFVKGSKG